MANGTVFVEYKEELLPKLIPAVIDSIWYPKNEEDGTEEDDGKTEDGAEVESN